MDMESSSGNLLHKLKELSVFFEKKGSFKF